MNINKCDEGRDAIYNLYAQSPESKEKLVKLVKDFQKAEHQMHLNINAIAHGVPLQYSFLQKKLVDMPYKCSLYSVLSPMPYTIQRNWKLLNIVQNLIPNFAKGISEDEKTIKAVEDFLFYKWESDTQKLKKIDEDFEPGSEVYKLGFAASDPIWPAKYKQKTKAMSCNGLEYFFERILNDSLKSPEQKEENLKEIEMKKSPQYKISQMESEIEKKTKELKALMGQVDPIKDMILKDMIPEDVAKSPRAKDLRNCLNLLIEKSQKNALTHSDFFNFSELYNKNKTTTNDFDSRSFDWFAYSTESIQALERIFQETLFKKSKIESEIKSLLSEKQEIENRIKK